MTKDEAFVLDCAKQIKRYCQKRNHNCDGCIFMLDDICALDEPNEWELQGSDRND